MTKERHGIPCDYLVPKEGKQFSITYDCPMPEELNIKKYNILIDSDPVDNQIYLELGYDKKNEYTSAYYLSPEHALEIGMHMVEIANNIIKQNLIYEKGAMEYEMLESYIAADLVDEIEFKPLKLYTKDVEDSLFGRMIIYVYYRSEQLMIEKSFQMLSRPIDTDSPLDYLVDFYNEHIKDVKVDEPTFYYLQDSICTLRQKWLQAHKGKNPGGKEYIKPKEELAELAKATMEEIRKNKRKA